jgi:hypothetical protein
VRRLPLWSSRRSGANIHHVKNMNLCYCMTHISSQTVIAICLVLLLLQAYLCTALPIQNTTENNCSIAHSQNTTALYSSVFLTEMCWLLTTKKRKQQLAFYRANLCPQSVPVPSSKYILFLWDIIIYYHISYISVSLNSYLRHGVIRPVSKFYLVTTCFSP